MRFPNSIYLTEYTRSFTMRNFFENCLRRFSVCFLILCNLIIVEAISAEEIIYASEPQNQVAIRISDVNGHNTRTLFNPPLFVMEISIQKGDRYILCVAEGIEPETGFDAYLFDTKQLHTGRKDLTLGRFSFVTDAAISSAGDVVFANIINSEYPDGIYLIPRHEVHEPIPKAEKLYDGAAGYVDWSPNGNDVVFSNIEGIFLLDILTKEVSQKLDYGIRPVFSPDGNKIAFIKYTVNQKTQKWFWEIGVLSLEDQQNVQIFEKTKTDRFLNYITWTPDGQSIAYVLRPSQQDRTQFSNFAVSIENGRIQSLFENIDGGVRVWEWTKKSYPITPIAKLTTTWGILKRGLENGGNDE